MKRLRSLCPPFRGYFRSQVGRLSIAGLRQPIGQPCHFGGGSDEGGIACLAASSTKDAPGSVSTARKLKLSLTSTLRQKQSQFESASSNRGNVTSKLSRHRGHSLLPLREFDQQLVSSSVHSRVFAGSIAVLARGSKPHQLRLRFGRDEGGRIHPVTL